MKQHGGLQEGILDWFPGRSVLPAQPGRAGLPLQQEGFKHSIPGRCLGAWWDCRCSRSVHMCSHASGSTGSLLKCCRVAAFVAEEKTQAVGRHVRSEGIRGCCRSESSVCSCLVVPKALLVVLQVAMAPGCEWQCWRG